MVTNISKYVSRKNAGILTITIACVGASYGVGMQTASVQPHSLVEAGSTNLSGDMTGDGILDTEDAIAVLEIAQGYAEPTSEQIGADPNGDGILTVDDAIRILHTIR